MNTVYLARLRELISAPRFKAYEPDAPFAGAEEEWLLCTLSRYFWNQALAEALYPVMQNVEVALRNTLDQAITVVAKRSDWFNGSLVLEGYEREFVKKAKDKLNEDGKNPNDPGRVVAELTFGFWIELLGRNHSKPKTKPPKRLWPDSLERAFPNADADLRKGQTRGIGEIRGRFGLVKRLRNRVSHHESILRGIKGYDGQFVSLQAANSQAIEAISWISTELAETVSKTSRLDAIWSAKDRPHIDLLLDLAHD